MLRSDPFRVSDGLSSDQTSFRKDYIATVDAIVSYDMEARQ